MKDYEVLVVSDNGNTWNVIGTSYSNALSVEQGSSILKASYMTIQRVKELLSEGKKVLFSKELEFPEAQLKDIIIEDSDELKTKKNIAMNDLTTAMHQTIIGISVLDVMEYMNNFIKLLNAGYQITDSNREEKYFEIIERSQENTEPEPKTDFDSFEEEQEYLNKVKEYNESKENLATLESYLNAYDKISEVKFVYDLMKNTRTEISNASTSEEINKIMEAYLSKIKDFKK